MAENNFKIGDVVRLRSGGPLMTVGVGDHKITLPEHVDCDWFDGCARQRERFSFEQLDIVGADEIRAERDFEITRRRVLVDGVDLLAMQVRKYARGSDD